MPSGTINSLAAMGKVSDLRETLISCDVLLIKI